MPGPPSTVSHCSPIKESNSAQMIRSVKESKKENLEVAFLKANQLLSIPQLLDSEDFILGESDEHSVMVKFDSSLSIFCFPQ